MELISRMMDGSITYDPEGRLEPVSSGPGAKQEDKIGRLKEVAPLLVISRRHFSALLGDVPGLVETILATLSRRVRQAEERAERLGSAFERALSDRQDRMPVRLPVPGRT